MVSRADGSLRGVKPYRGQSVDLSAFIERQRLQRSAGVEAELTGQRVGGHLVLNKSWPKEGGNVSNYIGQFSTSMLANSNGMAIGGSKLSDSAVLVELQGEGHGLFDILVNERAVARGRIGEKVPVVLSPFGEYDISIRAAADSFSDYDDRVQTVTLYPGNVAHVLFQVLSVEPALGRLQDEQENMLVNAVLLNSQDQAVTDSRGLFQTRLRDGLERLDVETASGERCQVVLPLEKKKKRGVALYGRLTCLPLSLPR